MKKARQMYSAPARYPGQANTRSTARAKRGTRGVDGHASIMTRALGGDGKADERRDDLVEVAGCLGAAGPPHPVRHHLRAEHVLDRGLRLRRERDVLHALLDALVDPLFVPHLDRFERLALD